MDIRPVVLKQEQASYVRRLRVEGGYTWRAIAEACFDVWPNEESPLRQWSMPINQEMGMLLCKVAAEQFGEDYMSDPWA